MIHQVSVYKSFNCGTGDESFTALGHKKTFLMRVLDTCFLLTAGTNEKHNAVTCQNGTSDVTAARVIKFDRIANNYTKPMNDGL